MHIFYQTIRILFLSLEIVCNGYDVLNMHWCWFMFVFTFVSSGLHTRICGWCLFKDINSDASP